jgi:hypothetical protein
VSVAHTVFTIVLLILAALAIVWSLNRRAEPRVTRTSEWRVSNGDDPYAYDEHMVPSLPRKPAEPSYQPHRPMWLEPAAKGIGGRRRA